MDSIAGNSAALRKIEEFEKERYENSRSTPAPSAVKLERSAIGPWPSALRRDADRRDARWPQRPCDGPRRSGSAWPRCSVWCRRNNVPSPDRFPHRADHFAGEQDVVDRDHPGQQVDARLVIDAGVEEDVVEQVILEQRLLQLLGEAAVAAPVIGAAPPPCGTTKRSVGKSLNRSPWMNCITAVVSALM